jgi:hypothetical protein
VVVTYFQVYYYHQVLLYGIRYCLYGTRCLPPYQLRISCVAPWSALADHGERQLAGGAGAHFWCPSAPASCHSCPPAVCSCNTQHHPAPSRRAMCVLRPRTGVLGPAERGAPRAPPQHDVSTGQKRFPEHNNAMRSYEVRRGLLCSLLNQRLGLRLRLFLKRKLRQQRLIHRPPALQVWFLGPRPISLSLDRPGPAVCWTD